MKFSIIIPVYNTEKYIIRCLESIKNQTYKNYEVICIDDGSKDNSFKLMKEFAKDNKQFNVLSKKNSGPSDTRNIGIEKATGDYICFLDSDDYLDKNFLKKIESKIKKDLPDVIKIRYQEFNEENINNLEKENIKIVNEKGKDALIKFITNNYPIDIPWLYLYSLKYWKQNNFSFIKGKFHEDFGLIPLAILNANKVTTINDAIYYYMVQRKGSTMSTNDLKFKLQKTDDVIFHYQNLEKEINSNKNLNKKEKDIINHYLENTVIAKICLLPNKYLKEYKQKLKATNIFKVDFKSNIKYIIKKIILNLNIKIYYKIIK